jgi:polysaccharide biosynthesis protein PslG
VANHTQPNFSNHPSFFFRRAEDYHNLMMQVGDNKPIWATETGYDSNGNAPAGYEYARTISEAQQADYLTREFAYAKKNWPWMGVMFVWNLNFQAVVPNSDEKWGFGVLNGDYSPRPAYTALQTMPK